MLKVREYRRRGKPSGMSEVDVRLTLPSGAHYRERVKVATGRANARRWAEGREAEVLRLAHQGLDPEAIRARLRGKGVNDGIPTLGEFKDRFVEHAKANRQKASTVYAKESIFRVHLAPFLGSKRLEKINAVDVQTLKVKMADYSPKTVNNVLACLSKCLRVAKKLGVIPTMPVESVELLKTGVGAVEFYTEEEYAALVVAAERLDPRTLVAVLLGGDAGLRAGEVVGLELADVSRSTISSRWSGRSGVASWTVQRVARAGPSR